MDVDIVTLCTTEGQLIGREGSMLRKSKRNVTAVTKHGTKAKVAKETTYL
jgi:hypothetical protein